jgi:hypothetical protein
LLFLTCLYFAGITKEYGQEKCNTRRCYSTSAAIKTLLLLHWCVLITSLSVVTPQLSLLRRCCYSSTVVTPPTVVTPQLSLLRRCCYSATVGYSATVVTPQLSLLRRCRYSATVATPPSLLLHRCCYSLLLLLLAAITPCCHYSVRPFAVTPP